jgi:hypothetical protein
MLVFAFNKRGFGLRKFSSTKAGNDSLGLRSAPVLPLSSGFGNAFIEAWGKAGHYE